MLSFYFSFPASTTFPFEHRLGRVALAYYSMHFSMSLPSLKCLKCFLCPEVISQWPYTYILCISVSIQVPRQRCIERGNTTVYTTERKPIYKKLLTCAILTCVNSLLPHLQLLTERVLGLQIALILDLFCNYLNT